MRGKNFGTAASPVIALGRASGGGPVLIARRAYTDFYNATSDTVPPGARRATVRCVGAGGSRLGTAYGGAGAAYARSDISCAPGQTINITIGIPKADNTAGGDTTVTLNSKTVKAVGGSPGDGPGGQAANCTGDIRRTGGAGSLQATGGTGQNGGLGGRPYIGSGTAFGSGGGSAGDIGDLDSVGLGGRGGSPDPNGGSQSGPPPGYGGGGAAYGFSGPGVAIIEFWSE